MHWFKRTVSHRLRWTCGRTTWCSRTRATNRHSSARDGASPQRFWPVCTRSNTLIELSSLLPRIDAPVPLPPSTSPCSNHPGTTLFTLFISPSFPGTKDSHCLDPLPVFKSSARCSSTAACPATEACIAPAPSERLMRIAVREVDHSHLIVWRGPKREVFDQGTSFRRSVCK